MPKSVSLTALVGGMIECVRPIGRACARRLTRSGSRRSRATRASIWRLRVRGGGRSKSIWKRQECAGWRRADRRASDARRQTALIA
ncbi:MAG TPA: hypothetical protein VEV40_13425 [Alloacidobacterium sp.]|nr:hypothetical protein [Alloacidobacterium sp.]HYK36959.1 hypothetical protein [Alloacidobacterium sp.]